MTQIADPSAGLGDAGDRIVLTGIVDAAAGERLGSLVAERLAGGTSSLAVDLSGVAAIDQDGLVAIVRIWHEMSTRAHPLSLLDPSSAIGPLLALTGLVATYTVTDTATDAAANDDAAADC